MDAADIFEQARALHEQGELLRAQDLYRKLVDIDPAHFEALTHLGVVSGQLNDLESALRYFDRAVELRPDCATALCNRGLALKGLGRLESALASFDRALILDNGNPITAYSRGTIHQELSHFDAALADYDHAIAREPMFAQAHFKRAIVLQQCSRLADALTSYDQAIDARPTYAEAHANKGFVLASFRRFTEALNSYDRAIATDPNHASTYLHRGNASKAIRRFDAALIDYDTAISIRPDYPEAFLNRGVVLYEIDRVDDALASYARAIELKPDYASAYFNRAAILRHLKQFDLAAADYAAAAALDPSIEFLPGVWLETKIQVCNWADLETDLAGLEDDIDHDRAVAHPFTVMAISNSSRLHRKAAEIWVRNTCPQDDSLGRLVGLPSRGKIRLGYFSGDFREHPTAHLISELIETHDRTRFEVTALSFGPATGDASRQRLMRAFDEFVELRGQSDAEIASAARKRGIDVAVDLCGYIHGSRPGIFALRAAPLQVNYLGYPGTMGAPYIDYLVADHTLIPSGCEKYYSEKIIYLPDSYQVNDTRRPVTTPRLTRRELGLPDGALVYCCFNNNYKIQPRTFASWMRILKRVPHSVLWLLEDNATAAQALRHEAHRAGLEPQRLVFGKRMPHADHLARQGLADLFLDTLPYNAHTGASDALWAGLPVLTCLGETFAGRVAASLLNAIGLPELIASDLLNYEDLAVELALNAPRLNEIKARLAANRSGKPLFDTRLFTAHLEGAFARIVERQRAHLAPDHIDMRQ